MKSIKSIFIIAIIIMCLCLINSNFVLAMEIGFSVDEISDSEQEEFLNNITFALLTEEPPKTPITCFDVNDNELIAIGSDNSDSKIICIYNTEGYFKYGYRFNCSGSFGLEWCDDDSINIYFVRSDKSVTVNSIGEVEKIQNIQDTIENNSYWNNYIFSTERTIGNYKYVIKNDMSFLNLFASSYSQLIRVNAEGNTSLIYDVNSQQLIGTIICLFSIVLFVGVVFMVIIRKIQYKPKNNSLHDDLLH